MSDNQISEYKFAEELINKAYPLELGAILKHISDLLIENKIPFEAYQSLSDQVTKFSSNQWINGYYKAILLTRGNDYILNNPKFNNQ
mgnify:CR=1 FL=1